MSTQRHTPLKVRVAGVEQPKDAVQLRAHRVYDRLVAKQDFVKVGPNFVKVGHLRKVMLYDVDKVSG